MIPDDDAAMDDLEEIDLEEINGPEEVEEVQTVLRSLLNKVENPILRVCLEDTLDEVAHLTSLDAGFDGMDDQEVA
jgi:hypothetical protein